MCQMGYSIRAPAGSLFLRPFNGRLRYEGLPGSTTLESADVWADVPRELTTTGVKRLFDRLRPTRSGRSRSRCPAAATRAVRSSKFTFLEQ
ncbi:hypothetical protein CBM2633_P90024 [Cupriavidus taiwanensis]|uniref:Uncharacterized protein n=2 Tax=Cupriavidus TaxID=106589 RepID=A0A375CSU2_9BURK|nr:hypothetical protein CBM2588_P100026 [Cupriavidus taiwanensis]SOZ40838.1 hypothetical protein CBM2605_P90024 [Cupriavidus neocaledonicus]SOY74140.1 hypothetical protein CBM2592_P120023 [Cupriavidus taiwanensis]SOY77139.1 hypothetical protein CBM2585_P90024 [Cupriavidus taiwanensis]SOY77401.1 hypothetical protein CBM2589_P90024 [Cupriavidus taiwanensis]